MQRSSDKRVFESSLSGKEATGDFRVASLVDEALRPSVAGGSNHRTYGPTFYELTHHLRGVAVS